MVYRVKSKFLIGLLFLVVFLLLVQGLWTAYQLDQKSDLFIIGQILGAYHEGRKDDGVAIGHYKYWDLRIGNYTIWQGNQFLRAWKWQNGLLVEISEVEWLATSDCTFTWQFWKTRVSEMQWEVILQLNYPECAAIIPKARAKSWTLDYTNGTWLLQPKKP